MADLKLKNKAYAPRHLTGQSAPSPAALRDDGDRYHRTAKARMKRRELITGPNKILREVAENRQRMVAPVNRQLIEFAERSHELNRRRMRNGVIWLFLLPVLLLIIRNMTDSSKVAFLIIWIFGMFVISAFLLMVAYSDNDLQERLRALQSAIPYVEETELDKLRLDNDLRELRRREQGLEQAIKEHIAERVGREADNEKD